MGRKVTIAETPGKDLMQSDEHLEYVFNTTKIIPFFSSNIYQSHYSYW